VLLTTSKPGARIHVFGFEAELAQVDMLYTSLVLQMARDLRRVRPPAGVRSVRAWNRSYLLGWVTAVITRARTAYATAQKEAEAERTSGPSTELVLADRSAQIAAELRSAYPTTRRTRITYSGRGYGQGHGDGQRANIHDRSGVGAGSRAIGR
jgi:multidrug resistance efflux pump